MPLYVRTANDSGSNQLEVYSWWTGPGEEDGLQAMVADFRTSTPASSS